MKKVILIFSVILIALNSLAQNKENLSSENIDFINDSTARHPIGNIDFINNSTIRYDIVLAACDTCAPIRNIGFRVILQLDSNQYKTILNIDANKWLHLLSQKTTDFAANIILYSIYDKEAIIFTAFTNPDKWRRAMKDDDLKHWQSVSIAK